MGLPFYLVLFLYISIFFLGILSFILKGIMRMRMWADFTGGSLLFSPFFPFAFFFANLLDNVT